MKALWKSLGSLPPLWRWGLLLIVVALPFGIALGTLVLLWQKKRSGLK